MKKFHYLQPEEELEQKLCNVVISLSESGFEQNQKNTTHAFCNVYLITIVSDR